MDDMPAADTRHAQTRRQFLISASALAGGVASSTALADTVRPSELHVSRADQAGVPEKRRALLVRLGTSTWTISPHLFGPRARLTHRVLSNDQGHVIELERALYPGTTLRADFSATIYQSSRTWVVRLNFAIVGVEAELGLLAWMSAEPAARYLGEFRGEDQKVVIGRDMTAIAPLEDNLSVAIDAKLRIEFSAPKDLVFATGRFDFSMRGARVSATDVLPPAHPTVTGLRPADGPFSLVDFDAVVSVDREIKVVLLDRRLRVSLVPGRTAAVSMVAFGHGEQRDAVLDLHGTDLTALIIRGESAGPQGFRLQLQWWRVNARANRLRDTLSLAGALPEAASARFGAATDGLAVTLSGLPRESFTINMERGSDPSFGIYALLHEVHLPLPTVSDAQLSFDHPLITWLTFGKAPPDPGRHATGATLHLGRKTSALSAGLDYAQLHLRRAADNLDLRFRLPYHRLQAGSEPATLRRQPLPNPIPQGLPDQHCLVVTLPPQHEYEEAFEIVGSCADAQKNLPSLTKAAPAQSRRPRRRKLGDRKPDLARTLLAEPSRLVFQLPPGNDQPQGLTVDLLTNWSTLPLVVNQRALPRTAGLQAQLDLVGIHPETKRPDARRLIAAHIRANMPGAFQTAIEPVYRMIVSPDSGARFSTPPPLEQQRHPVLWSTELLNPEDVAVRALWARGMSVDDSLSTLSTSMRPLPFAGSLYADQAEEIVGLTSFYGLAALRRLKDPNAPAPGPAAALRQISHAVARACSLPQQKKWHDDPNGMVFLPAEPYAYLTKPPACEVAQEGVMVARPFDRFRLRLGQAADVDAYWKGEPPSPISKDPFFPQAFNIERYTHRIVQGRDAFVEVLEKGFLFPLGHRATFLQVTYRDYQAYLDNPMGDPTAYLAQEFYIVCNQPDKRFQAYGQPFASRDFPCASVNLATPITPKLADPVRINIGGIGQVFWPQQSCAGNAPVSFAYKLDGQPEEVRSQLIFVNNAAAHHPETMRALTHYYNALAGKDLEKRTARHGGASRRYAPEGKAGECSFKTDHWLLSARGRLLETDGVEFFDMDGFMEGEDQPPFYPIVEKARINVASVERLTGQAGLYIDAAFNPGFVLNGFDGKINPSEIYLDVLTPEIHLSGSNSQGATGGVASMAAQLAGLSRKIGPVGGKPLDARSAARTATVQKAVAPTPGSPIPPRPAVPGGTATRTVDMSAAVAGSFSPFEFLGDAKVLGVLYLRDLCKAALISAAPKLLEQAEYGMAAARTLEDFRLKLVEAAAFLKRAVDDALTESQRALRELMKNEAARLDDLYGPLAQAMRRVISVCELIAALKHDATMAEIQGAANALKTAVEDLVSELEALSKNPMPSIVGDTLAKVEGIWKALRDPIGSLADRMAAIFLDQVLDALFRKLSGNPNTLALILGAQAARRAGESIAAYERRILALLRNPSVLLGEVRNALLYEAFSKPMLTVLQLFSNAQQAVEARIEWSRERVRTLVAGVLCRGGSALLIPELDTIATKIVQDIEEALEKEPLKTLPGRIEGVLAKALEDARPLLQQRMETLSRQYKAEADKKWGELKKMGEPVGAALEREYRRLQIEYRRLLTLKQSADAVFKTVTETGWAGLARDVIKELKAEFDRAIQAAFDAAKAAALAKAEDLAGKAVLLARASLDIVEKWSRLADLHKLGASIETLCQGAGGKLTKALRAFADGLLPAHEVIDGHLAALDTELHDAIVALDEYEALGHEADKVREQAAATLQLWLPDVGTLRRLSDELKVARATWNAGLSGACSLDRIFADLNRISELRARILEVAAGLLGSIQDALGTHARLALPPYASFDRYKAAIKRAHAQVQSALGELTGLAGIARPLPAWTELLAFATASLPEPERRAFADMAALANRWKNDPAKALDSLSVEYRGLQRRLAETLVQLILPKKDFVDPVLAAIKALGQAFGTALLPVHKTVETRLGDLKPYVQPDSVLATILPVRFRNELAVAETMLATDLADLGALQSTGDPKTLQKLGGRWQTEGSGLVRLARLTGQIIELIASGNVAELFDFARLRSELVKAVASFLPTRLRLNYDFDSELGDFPAGSPIFAMNRAAYGSAQERSYGPERSFPQNDLVLKTEVMVDLLTQERRIVADGRIRPFSLHMLGSLDFITLSFSGLHFRSTPGGSTKIDTELSGVRIGALLEFLTLLQNFLGPGSGNGVYRELSFFPPALEVGYRYNEPIIDIGGMQLLNVGFRVGALLPLDDRQAEFFAYLSSREAPLLIVMFPYAGGGFIGLRATARGIVSFEIQLEFGFAGAMRFGPLRATARATAGFYLLQNQSGRVFEGFVHALGDGQVGCFGVGVNIEIRMIQRHDGSMAGSSRYSYSFKVGFVKIRFTVTASREQSNGNSGGRRAAGAETAAGMRLLGGGKDEGATPPCPQGPAVISHALHKERQWKQYKRYLDLEENA